MRQEENRTHMKALLAIGFLVQIGMTWYIGRAVGRIVPFAV